MRLAVVIVVVSSMNTLSRTGREGDFKRFNLEFQLV